jgi:drug/metabolite transporter (DMT)-like permease
VPTVGQEAVESTEATRQPAWLPYLWMLLGSAAFALMGTLAYALRTTCDWRVIALARSGLVLVFAMALARATGRRLVFWRPGILWVRSVAGSLSLVCTFFALTRLPVSDVLTLTNTFPLWVVCLSWPLLGETPPGSVWLAVAGGVLGVALVQQPHFAQGNTASLLALGAALSTAVAMLGLHRLEGIDAWAILVHFSAVAVLFCVASFFLFDRDGLPWTVPSSWDLLLLLGVGGSATVGQLFLTKAFTAGPPAQVSVIGLSQIAFALLLEVVLWGRSPGLASLLGACLVVAPTGWLLTRSSLRAWKMKEEA